MRDIWLLLATRCDQFFLAAGGYEVGASLYEPDMIDVATELMRLARSRGVELLLPDQVVCASELSERAVASAFSVSAVPAEQMIVDLGHEFTRRAAEELAEAGTIIWNGPVGVFEIDQFFLQIGP